MSSLLERLKQRKLFQWALAYVAAAWVCVEVLSVVSAPWGFSDGIMRAAQAVLVLGLPFVLVLAWYHGEKGRQRVSGPELLIMTSLLALAGVALVVIDPLAEVEPVAQVAGEIDPNSIVVLPFLNISSDPEQEYMSDGLAEELRSVLAQIPELVVTPRTTAFSFKGRDDLTVRQIASQIGVAHVLAGAVRKAGNTIRITAELIDARTESHLFSQTFDRVFEDIFQIQSEITERVVSELRITLLGEIPTLRETDPEAYRLFLEARHIADRISPESYAIAVPMFERVREIDPEFAPVYLELAAAYHDEAVTMGVRPRQEGLSLALEAAERALTLDPDFAYAHGMLGAVVAENGDLSAGAEHIERALELAPRDHEILMGSGTMYTWQLGRSEAGIPLYEHVRQREPVYEVNLGNLAFAYWAAERWEELVEITRTILGLNPNVGARQVFLSYGLLELGDLEGALAAAGAESEPAFRLTAQALVYLRLGRAEDFERALEQLRAFGPVVPSLVAGVYAYTGDVEAAFTWLEQVGPDTFLGKPLTFAPFFRNLHHDPRWDAYRERMGQAPEVLDAIRFTAAVPR